MKKSFYCAASWIGLSAALFVGGMSLGFVLSRLDSDPGDSATWAGALLAGLAFGGTIWIATNEARNRNREAIEIARLVAADVSGTLDLFITNARNLWGYFAFYSHDEPVEPIAEFVAHYLSHSLVVADVRQLAQLNPLPNRASHRIARGSAMVRSTILEIAPFYNLQSNWLGLRRESRIEYVSQWVIRLQQAIDMLDIAYRECSSAAETGAPEPTFEDLYGDIDLSEDGAH